LRGREHIAIGVVSTTVVVAAAQFTQSSVDLPALGLAMLAAAAGSLAPDTDHPGSLASVTIPATACVYAVVFLVARQLDAASSSPLKLLSRLGPEWVLAAWLSLAAGLTLFLVSFVLGAVFGHRGPVHSIAFGIAATAAVFVGLAIFRAPLWLAVPFAWGWMAHLLADARTPDGLPSVAWPLAAKRPWSV
jgi:membrane-bound metal-dependent hydrolase YbcI (DUF457 family)